MRPREKLPVTYFTDQPILYVVVLIWLKVSFLVHAFVAGRDPTKLTILFVFRFFLAGDATRTMVLICADWVSHFKKLILSIKFNVLASDFDFVSVILEKCFLAKFFIYFKNRVSNTSSESRS